MWGTGPWHCIVGMKVLGCFRRPRPFLILSETSPVFKVLKGSFFFDLDILKGSFWLTLKPSLLTCGHFLFLTQCSLNPKPIRADCLRKSFIETTSECGPNVWNHRNENPFQSPPCLGNHGFSLFWFQWFCGSIVKYQEL